MVPKRSSYSGEAADRIIAVGDGACPEVSSYFGKSEHAVNNHNPGGPDT
jgi:hypothetical protein